jgi:NADH-quinone oxidoreductase subunit H
MFFVAEYTNLFIVSAIATTLFLGGWQGPFLPPVVWFLLKSYALVFLSMWVRWTLPRVRMDQMMSFAWKVLTPLSLLNLLVSGWFMLK